jgi:hypothetical protein
MVRASRLHIPTFIEQSIPGTRHSGYREGHLYNDLTLDLRLGDVVYEYTHRWRAHAG